MKKAALSLGAFVISLLLFPIDSNAHLTGPGAIGTLVKPYNSDSVYEYQNYDVGELWLIPDTATFNARGHSWDDVVVFDADEMAHHQRTVTILSEGAAIRSTDDTDVWIVKYAGQKQFRRLVLSPQVFESYEHLRWEDVIEVSPATLMSFTESRFVREDGDVIDWYLQPSGDTGTRHSILDTDEACRAERIDDDAVYTINSVDFAQYVDGGPILPPPLWIGSSSTDYLVAAKETWPEPGNAPSVIAWHDINTSENEVWANNAFENLTYAGVDAPVFSWNVCVDAVPSGPSEWSIEVEWEYTWLPSEEVPAWTPKGLGALRTKGNERYIQFFAYNGDGATPGNGFTAEFIEAYEFIWLIEGPYAWETGKVYRFEMARTGNDLVMTVTDEDGNKTIVGTQHLGDNYPTLLDDELKSRATWVDYDKQLYGYTDPLYPIDVTFSDVEPIEYKTFYQGVPIGNKPIYSTNQLHNFLGVEEQAGEPSWVRFWQ